MRRLLLASVLALAPSLAFAQAVDANGTPPPPGMDQGPMADQMGRPMMGPYADHAGKWKHMVPSGYMLMKFYAANTSHDGHLTLAQAKAADFKPVVDHFSQIDTYKHGYVTFYDIQAWRMDDMAKHLEEQAAALRAKDE